MIANDFIVSDPLSMAAIFNTLGKLGLGIAVAGGVVQTALYNGETCQKISSV